MGCKARQHTKQEMVGGEGEGLLLQLHVGAVLPRAQTGLQEAHSCLQPRLQLCYSSLRDSHVQMQRVYAMHKHAACCCLTLETHNSSVFAVYSCAACPTSTAQLDMYTAAPTCASKQCTGATTSVATFGHNPQLVHKPNLLADGRFLGVCNSRQACNTLQQRQVLPSKDLNHEGQLSRG
jgi:hypothetical protein